MFQVNIESDLTALKKAAYVFRRGFDENDLSETRDAVKAGGQAIQSEWSKYISGTPVSYSGGSFIINRVSGQYANAVVDGLRYPMDGNNLKSGVVVNLDYADRLERGFGPFDEKTGLLESPKVRWTVGDNPHPYINVPFQHSEQSIPRVIKSEVTRTGSSLGVIRLGSGLGSGLAGQRSSIVLRNIAADSQGNHHGYTWSAGMFSGMIRDKTGPEDRGRYMTFRRVSLASDPASWIHPGVSPKPVTKAIKENIGAKLTGMVSSAFERDVLRLSRLAGLIP